VRVTGCSWPARSPRPGKVIVDRVGGERRGDALGLEHLAALSAAVSNAFAELMAFHHDGNLLGRQPRRPRATAR
jgi:hypothetical protein